MPPLSTSLEDYLEAVYTLGGRDGVRASRISALLKVSKPSVSAAMRVLASRGLITQERYGLIRLSPAGTRAGAEIAGRHNLLKDFFVSILGLDEEKAEENACRAEHALSREALGRVGRLSVFLKGPRRGPVLAAARSFVSGRPS